VIIFPYKYKEARIMKITAEITIDELLEFLEKPENEDQIRYLSNLEHLKNLDEIGGFVGVLVKIGTKFAKKHISAMMALAECKTNADITAFRQTEHYKALKKGPAKFSMDNVDLKSLEGLKVLENMKELENLKK